MGYMYTYGGDLVSDGFSPCGIGCTGVEERCEICGSTYCSKCDRSCITEYKHEEMENKEKESSK